MFTIPLNSTEMFKEIEEWIIPQNKQMQTMILLDIYRVYIDAKLNLLAAELLDEE